MKKIRFFNFKDNDLIEIVNKNHDYSNSSVVGNLYIINNFLMIPLEKSRTIRVWVPSTYHLNNIRYPVIYMHDGQNLFDKTTSFLGVEWEVDESIETMINDDILSGFIVVGIDNGPDRMIEYLPNWDNQNGEGALYGQFIVKTLKPFIDEHFRTLKNKENTLIGGSSMGGLISFDIGLRYPDIFGYIMAMSTSFQIPEKGKREKFLNSITLSNETRLYLDSGYPKDNSEFIEPVKLELLEKGFNQNNLFTKITPGHSHSESDWAKRFMDAIIWLYNSKI